nr:ribonuclease H-like domain-containing protein [Tanacetum cinerariifolium]
MESLSPQVVSVAKLPILNPNEFDLWKMRIEQYFLMTDYSLWEVILNGESPAPTRVIEGVVQLVAHTTAEQRLARKNELKARGTLLMALLDKHQLKFHIHKDAKTLMEAIEKSIPTEWRTHTFIWRNKTVLEEQSLDDLFNNLKIYEVEVKNYSSASTSTQNIAFVSSQNTDNTNDLVSAIASVSVASAKIPVFALPNVDTLRHEGILEQMDLLLWDLICQKWSATTATGNGTLQESSFQAEEEPINYALMAFTSSSSSRFDNETSSLPTNETIFEEDIKLLNLKVQLRHNALVILRQKFKKSEQERDDLKLKLEKFQISSMNLSYLLASQTNDKTGLGYNTQVFTSSMFDCDEMFRSKTDESLPASPKYDRYHSGDRYHDVPPPYTGTFMSPKPDLVFHDAPNVHETVHTVFNVELSPTKPDKELSHRPSSPIIEDWVSDSEDDSEAEIPHNAPSFIQPTKQVKPPRPSVKPVENSIPAANLKTTIPKPKTHGNSRNRKVCFVCKSLTHLIKDYDYYENIMAQTPARNHAQRGNHQNYARITLPNPQRNVAPTAVLTKSKLVPLTAARQVTTAVSPTNVTRPRPAKTIVTKPHSPPRRHINRRPSPTPSNFPLKVTVVKAPMVNAVKGNTSYLFDFEEINDGYVAFGGNPKGGKIYGKDPLGKFDGKVDEGFLVGYSVSCKAFRVFNSRARIVQETLHINFLENKPNVTVSGPTWLFDIDTLTKTMNYQPVIADPQNTDGDAAFEVKEPEFKGKKPESEVHVLPTNSAQTKKHDDKTKREAKGKSHIELSTGYRNLSAEFEDFSDNIINEVNVADFPVPAVGQISTYSTNTFSAAGPSNTAVSPTHGKSSYMDYSQYLDDPNMPALEDNTYSDDEEDVGTKADFTNLETNITFSPIPTTRVHKDHPVTQIIGDLSSATQIRSMTRVVKDQG